MQVGRMNFSRLGLVFIAAGALSLASFIATPVNPSVTIADLGLLSVLVGVLAIFFGLDRKRTTHGGDAGRLVVTGWIILSAGLFVALGAFLLLNQVMCAEACDLSAYWVPIYGGLLMATVGLAVLFAGRLLKKPLESRSSEAVE